MVKGKVAIVTGAGRGIGRAVAIELAANGAMVVVNDLGATLNGAGVDASPANEVVAEIGKMGGKAVANFDSVATVEGGERIISTAVDTFGRLDVVVNNAGILKDRMIFNMTEEEWDSVIAVHLKGQYCCTKPATALFRQQKSGRIISMSSPAALGNMGQANYAAAKAGILGFIRTVAWDMAKYGVTANAIWPRADTRMTLTPEVLEKKAKGGFATSALRDPSCVAALVVYLASDKAAGINGQTFDVGGGVISLVAPEMRVKTIYKDVKWEAEELANVMPTTLAHELVQPRM